MQTWYYEVVSIDGDYANLVARALLPAGIYVGCKLKYEMFQYELVEQ